MDADASLALAWLTAHDPKRARSYDPATRTVTCWRKVYNRRKDGTIVGYHDGAQGRWEPYSRDICEYVAHAQTVAARKEENLASFRADLAASWTRAKAAMRAALDLRAQAVPGLPQIAITCMRNDAERQRQDAARRMLGALASHAEYL